MKNFRFYLEHETAALKRAGTHSGNVFAALIYDDHKVGVSRGRYIGAAGHVMVEGIGALTNEANASVCGTSASADWLRWNCKRISEGKAREIHPRLFVRLDRE
jgi:hypothetical protein